MRQRIGRLVTITALGFAAAIVSAAPAQARNIGGFGGTCTSSPGAVDAQGNNGIGVGAYCLCVIVPGTRLVLAGVNGPGSNCPPGILNLQDRKG